MKIYISSRCQAAGRAIRAAVRDAGHTVVSRWLDAEGYTGLPSDEVQRRELAVENLRDVREAEALILRAEPDGSFVPGASTSSAVPRSH
jgi:hypothetical protein